MAGTIAQASPPTRWGGCEKVCAQPPRAAADTSAMKLLTILLTTFAAILATVLATTQEALADDADQVISQLEDQLRAAWYRDSESGAWLLADAATEGMEPAPCARLLARLRALAVPATRTIELIDDSRDLPRGTHALPAVRAACDAIEHAGKIKLADRWIQLAAETTSVTNTAVFQRCNEIYARVVQAGVSPRARVPERPVRVGATLVAWSGTLEELVARHCEAPRRAAESELAQRAAPYRKHLRGDKLALVLGHHVTAAYALPGGDWSMKPTKLAASRVWFDSTSAPSTEVQTCRDGRRRTLIRRYVFDAAHKLVTTTTAEYCGQPGRAAFR
jgi:hypothetical protein